MCYDCKIGAMDETIYLALPNGIRHTAQNATHLDKLSIRYVGTPIHFPRTRLCNGQDARVWTIK